MAGHRRRTTIGRIVHSVATLSCALLIYYKAPLRLDDLSDVVGVTIFLAGLGGLVWLILRQVVRYVGEPPNAGGRVFGILTVIYAVVIFFAWIYYLIERNSPGEFVQLETRTDALYYTIVTLGTVGYGDVYAAGQTGRIVTMLQITFDLVVLGALFAVASAQIVDRLKSVRAERRAGNAVEPIKDDDGEGRAGA